MSGLQLTWGTALSLGSSLSSASVSGFSVPSCLLASGSWEVVSSAYFCRKEVSSFAFMAPTQRQPSPHFPMLCQHSSKLSRVSPCTTISSRSEALDPLGLSAPQSANPLGESLTIILYCLAFWS